MTFPDSDPQRLLEQTRWGGKLPSFSLAGMMLLRMRDASEETVDAVAGAISLDERLTDLVLHLAHSVPHEADDHPVTLHQVVETYRPGAVRNVALALNLAACNRVGVCEGFNYDRFWTKSLVRAVAALELGVELGWGDPVEAFSVGLLANVGVLTLAGAYPEEYADVRATAKGRSREQLMELERQAFGVDHSTMSQAFLSYMGYSKDTCAAIEAMVKDEAQESEPEVLEQTSTSLLLAADHFADVFSLGVESQVGMWLELVNIRHRIQVERDAFNHLGDRVSHQWWAWGDRLAIPTTHVPSFAELAQMASEEEEEQGETTQASKAASPIISGDGMKILIVDDDPMSLRLVQTHLERNGHDVKTATNGKEGLISALEDTPHLIVADWVMPEMDGLELCRALRRFDAGRRIFFMLVTGKEEEAKIVEAFDAGVDDFLAKPIRPKPFIARVRAAQRVIILQSKLDEERRLLRDELSRSKTLARKLRMAALTDVLTELPNRRSAIKRLAEEWESSVRTGRPLSAIMIDIDHFKSINDTYGHDIGDVVLRETAHILENNTRKSESACRLGGEEFLVICGSTDLEEASRCAERLRSAVESNVIHCEGYDGHVTVSLGVSHRTPDVKDLDHLLKLADEAVYEAKAGGRNRVVLSPGPQGGMRAAS